MPFSGDVTFQKNYNREFTGELNFTGALQKSTAYNLSVGGILEFAGDLTTAVSVLRIDGVLRFLGNVTFLKNGVPVGGEKRSTILHNFSVSIGLGKFGLHIK